MKFKDSLLVALLCFIFFMIFWVKENMQISVCNFNSDPYMKAERELEFGEFVKASTVPVMVAVLGGRHHVEPEKAPYICQAPAGTEFVVVFEGDRLIATHIYPQFDPIVNEQWGVKRIIFLQDNLQHQIPTHQKFNTKFI